MVDLFYIIVKIYKKYKTKKNLINVKSVLQK